MTNDAAKPDCVIPTGDDGSSNNDCCSGKLIVTLINDNLVNRLSWNKNGYHLYLKNTYKSTNQRRNSIQNAPTQTKLGKPKTDPTMVILAAFYILLTHICSALCLMPRDQFWRSNAFSPCQKLPISGQHESDYSSTGCWHIHNQINTTTKRRHNPKKHIRKKPIFLTLTITKKDGSNVHQAGPLVRRRTNVLVVLIILQLSYTINVRIVSNAMALWRET